MTRLAAAFAFALIASTAIGAQARPLLRGEVVHGDERTPAGAVLIEVIDALGGVAGRSLSEPSGRFWIRIVLFCGRIGALVYFFVRRPARIQERGR